MKSLAQCSFGMKRRSFQDREYVFQTLYKAQNLGFYKSIYENNIIERCFCAHEHALAFAGARNFSRACAALPAEKRKGWGRSQLSGSSLLIAPSNLAALGLVAEAWLTGLTLIVEECPFTSLFLQPLARRVGNRVEFLPFARLPQRLRALATERFHHDTLFVTFPDRPFDSIKGSVEVSLLGKPYLFSIVESVLSRLPLDRVFQLGEKLSESGRIANAEGIAGRLLTVEAQARAMALETAIVSRPHDYLGWSSLYSRSRLYFELLRSNVRGFFQCWLRHSRDRGFSSSGQSYPEWLRRLERTTTDVTPV